MCTIMPSANNAPFIYAIPKLKIFIYFYNIAQTRVPSTKLNRNDGITLSYSVSSLAMSLLNIMLAIEFCTYPISD